MIVGIEGGLGAGKTALMSILLKTDFERGFQVLANYWLNFKHKELDILNLLDKKANLKDVSIGIDEITVFMDCRTSGSKLNRIISYFILQSRKRNVTLYYTTQDFNMVDLRLIKHTHIQVFCNNLFDENGQQLDAIKKYVVLDLRNPRNPVTNSFYLDISPIFSFYDTDEVINPPI